MVSTARVSVTTTPTLIYSHTGSAIQGDYRNKRVVLINASTTPAVLMLGPLGVTTASGARWLTEAGRTLSIELEPGEAIYGIVAAGTQDIDVLANGQ